MFSETKISKMKLCDWSSLTFSRDSDRHPMPRPSAGRGAAMVVPHWMQKMAPIPEIPQQVDEWTAPTDEPPWNETAASSYMAVDNISAPSSQTSIFRHLPGPVKTPAAHASCQQHSEPATSAATAVRPLLEAMPAATAVDTSSASSSETSCCRPLSGAVKTPAARASRQPHSEPATTAATAVGPLLQAIPAPTEPNPATIMRSNAMLSLPMSEVPVPGNACRCWYDELRTHGSTDVDRWLRNSTSGQSASMAQVTRRGPGSPSSKAETVRREKWLQDMTVPYC